MLPLLISNIKYPNIFGYMAEADMGDHDSSIRPLF